MRNLSIGKAGEFRVASELLLRGYDIFMPVTDGGIDLIINQNIKIQVKASHKSKLHKAYMFTFKSWRRKENKYIAHPLTDIDFVVCWAIEDDYFLIVPAKELDGKYSIRFFDAETNNIRRSQYKKFKDNWDILNDSKSNKGGDALMTAGYPGHPANCDCLQCKPM